MFHSWRLSLRREYVRLIKIKLFSDDHLLPVVYFDMHFAEQVGPLRSTPGTYGCYDGIGGVASPSEIGRVRRRLGVATVNQRT